MEQRDTQTTPHNTDLPAAWLRLAAETTGMCLFVAISSGSLTAARLIAAQQHHALSGDDWLLVGLGHGLAFFVATTLANRVSGAHLNPAVTLALATIKRFPWALVFMQVLAQLIGGIIGTVAILVIFGCDAVTIAQLGAPALAVNTSLAQGLVSEGLGTGILLLTLMGTSMDERSPVGWAPLAAGSALIAATFFLGSATSALFNPGRALGPFLLDALLGVSVDWLAYIVVYSIGPLLGAVAACYLYLAIARPSRRELHIR